MLGLRPFRGRFFQPSDDVAPGGSPYAVLSYDYWRTTFDTQDSVIGTTILINTQPYTVTLTSGVACTWPAWRALRVDPAAALATE